MLFQDESTLDSVINGFLTLVLTAAIIAFTWWTTVKKGGRKP